MHEQLPQGQKLERQQYRARQREASVAWRALTPAQQREYKDRAALLELDRKDLPPLLTDEARYILKKPLFGISSWGSLMPTEAFMAAFASASAW